MTPLFPAHPQPLWGLECFQPNLVLSSKTCEFVTDSEHHFLSLFLPYTDLGISLYFLFGKKKIALDIRVFIVSHCKSFLGAGRMSVTGLPKTSERWLIDYRVRRVEAVFLSLRAQGIPISSHCLENNWEKLASNERPRKGGLGLWPLKWNYDNFCLPSSVLSWIFKYAYLHSFFPSFH